MFLKPMIGTRFQGQQVTHGPVPADPIRFRFATQAPPGRSDPIPVAHATRPIRSDFARDANVVRPIRSDLARDADAHDPIRCCARSRPRVTQAIRSDPMRDYDLFAKKTQNKNKNKIKPPNQIKNTQKQHNITFPFIFICFLSPMFRADQGSSSWFRLLWRGLFLMFCLVVPRYFVVPANLFAKG